MSGNKSKSTHGKSKAAREKSKPPKEKSKPPHEKSKPPNEKSKPPHGKSNRRRLDITGERFGKLVAIEPTDQNRRGYVVWRCRCDCGGETLASTKFLKEGWAWNCGCIVRKHYRDLSGQRFGRLMVLGPSMETMPDGRMRERHAKDRRILWECKCDCGNMVSVSAAQLMGGYRKSCNCLSRPVVYDWVGKRFGKLTVLEYAGRRNGAHRWKCKCDCGNITTVWQSNLKNGHTTSCGCLVKPFASRTVIDGTCIEMIRSRALFKTNTSGVRGVYPVKKSGKWAAQIQFRGEKTYLGAFDTVEEAAKVRQQAEIVYEQFLQQYDRIAALSS